MSLRRGVAAPGPCARGGLGARVPARVAPNAARPPATKARRPMGAATGAAGSAQQVQRRKNLWVERVMDHLSQGANAPTANEGTSFSRTGIPAAFFFTTP